MRGLDYQAKECKDVELLVSNGYFYCERKEGSWGYVGYVEEESCSLDYGKRQVASFFLNKILYKTALLFCGVVQQNLL
jgi:hypothetical protein